MPLWRRQAAKEDTGAPQTIRALVPQYPADRVQKAYDQHDYSTEAKHWWQQWGAHRSWLDKGGKGLAEVVKIRVTA